MPLTKKEKKRKEKKKECNTPFKIADLVYIYITKRCYRYLDRSLKDIRYLDRTMKDIWK